jgi:serine/threonine protein kinase
MGVATEIDHAEAYAGLDQLRLRMSVLVGLLLVGTIALFFYTVVLDRMRSQVDRAQKLGRYELMRKVGEGGMGAVYLARHAMLRRPTAIKLLRPETSSEESLIRFEREVQVTSALTHPNTISIYDYGRTPEGVFYYAMEYLEGLTLGHLVEHDGAQPPARVVHIMKQVCASLAEAHATGLIHRDLKPANVMLCEQGRVLDFVKVLDFGLVRTLANEESIAVTQLDSLTGTPLYLSPEAVENPESLDQRADLYQLGAIAYYLLTGRHVFKGQNVVEVVGQHLHSEPEPPSKALGKPLPPELEAIVLRCLAKRPEDRPDDAFALGRAFSECGVEPWTQSDAEAWWSKYRAAHPDAGGDGEPSTGTLPSGIGVDFAGRRMGKTS